MNRQRKANNTETCKKMLKYCIENKFAAWGLDDGSYNFSSKIPNNKIHSLHSTEK